VVSDGKTLSLTRLGTGQLANAVSFIFSAPSDGAKDHTISIDKDVGAISQALLDGLYTGKAGSGNFSVTVKPIEKHG
jgi:hypothetical protein